MPKWVFTVLACERWSNQNKSTSERKGIRKDIRVVVLNLVNYNPIPKFGGHPPSKWSG